MDDYLSHHGIKGQKWGVRNAEWYPISEYQKHLNRTTYKKGQKFYRISTSPEDASGGERYKYVSSTKRDRDRYKGLFTQEILFDSGKYDPDDYYSKKLKDIVKDFNDKGKHLYEIEYKSISDLKGPSEKERKDIYKSILDKDPSILDKIKDTLEHDPWFEMRDSNGNKIDISKEIDKAKKDKSYNETIYNLFKYSVGTPESGVMDKLVSELKDRGYNSIYDDNDGGEVTDKPLIIIDPGQYIERTCSRELLAKDIGEAYNRTMLKYQTREPRNKDNYKLLDEDQWK